MRRSTLRHVLLLLASSSFVLCAAVVHAQDDAARVEALLRDLKGRDYEKASAAEGELHQYPRARAQVVAGLIDALRTGEWDRCSGDMRDAIARTVTDLKARDAVVPLLDLVKNGKSIEHECAE